MGKKIRILTLILALILFAMPFLSVGNAATYDYKDTHTAISSDGKATITKSAKWTNEAEGKAEITIKVKVNEQPQVKDVDVIYLIDRSSSMGQDVGLTYNGKYNNSSKTTMYEIETGVKIPKGISGIMAYLMPHFIEDANSNNRIAIAAFASGLFTYDTESEDTKNSVRCLHYYHTGYADTLKNDKWKSDIKYTAEKLNANYSTYSKDNLNELRTRITNAFEATKSLKFYSSDDLEYVKNKVLVRFRGGIAGENTNFDMGLFAAEYLLSQRTRTDKNRKAHVIFITEGQPFPDNDKDRKEYGGGTNKYKVTYNSDYAANLYYKDISENIRNTYGATIHAIILDRAKADTTMWETICDAENVYYVKDEVKAPIDKIKEIHQKIESSIAGKNQITVTDYINTEFFDFNGTTASDVCASSIGSVEIDENTGKVIWNLGSDFKYGEEYTLTIKINLNEKGITATEDYLNTNKLGDNDDGDDDDDDNCILDYGDGEVEVETPWLPKKSCTVTVEYIDDENNTTIQKISDTLNQDATWPSDDTIKGNYAVTNPLGQWGEKYKNYYLDTSNIEIDGKKYTYDNMPNNITVDTDKVIKFHYKPAVAVEVRSFLLTKEGDVYNNGVNQIGGYKEEGLEKGQEKYITKPSMEYTYLGAYVHNDKIDITSSEIKNKINYWEENIEVKLDRDVTYVDFIFEEVIEPEIKPEEPEKPEPVVSYPEIMAEHKSKAGEKLAILGEKIQIAIPNIEEHPQAEELGLVQPEGGWNLWYGKSKWIECDCDVYFNGVLKEKNKPFRVSLNEDKSFNDGPFTLVIPEWVEEKTYTITSYVSTTDALPSEEKIGKEYNQMPEQTAAYGENKIEVVGKLYDFTITNLIEDKYWPNSLFPNKTTEYKANTLPIGKGDNQPAKYNYGISLGSTFFFNVNTIGQKNNKVSIVPQFKYVTKEGTIKDADIYVKNNGKYENITKTTSGIQTYLNNEHKKTRTNLKNELEKALKMTSYKTLETNRKYTMGAYSNLLIDATQKVPYVKYFEEENVTRYASDTDKNKVLEAVSHWYGEYRLPSSTIVMEKGKTPGNGTEYKDGFIIVMFQVKTKDSSGKDYLVYNEQQAVGNQWKNEEGKAEGETLEIQLPKVSGQKTNSKVKIKVENGFYPVAIYQVGIKVNGSYEIAGTH